MSSNSAWPGKIMALLRAGNVPGAVAQIRVAPGVRELRSLQKLLATGQPVGRWPDVDTAIDESLKALSAPRLHRSP